MRRCVSLMQTSMLCLPVQDPAAYSTPSLYPYPYLDDEVLKRSWAHDVRNVSLPAALGGDTDCYSMILGVAEGHKEDKSG
jgi:transposase-like protein